MGFFLLFFFYFFYFFFDTLVTLLTAVYVCMRIDGVTRGARWQRAAPRGLSEASEMIRD